MSSIQARVVRTLQRRLGLAQARRWVEASVFGRPVTFDVDLSGVRAAARSVSVTPEAVQFDLLPGATPAAPLIPRHGEQIDLTDVILLRASVVQTVPAVGMSLAVEVRTRSGTSLGRVPLQLGQGRRDWFIALPPEAASAVLALRFAGQGRLSPFRFTIHGAALCDLEAIGGVYPDAANVADVTASVHDAARALFRRRDYDRILDLQTRALLDSSVIRRLTLASLIEKREFETALSWLETVGKGDEPGDWLALRLAALANLQLWDDVEAVIANRLSGSDGVPRPDSDDDLVYSYPFTAPFPLLRARLIDRMADLQDWRAPMLDAANRALFMPSSTARTRLIARGLTDPHVPPADRLMLASQRALRDGDFGLQRDRLNAALATWSLTPVVADDSCALAMGAFKGGPTPAVQADQDLVSVVMTTFNSAATLTYAVGSLLAQTHGNLQLVIVDDASTDDTVLIASSMAAADPRIVVLPQAENHGTYVCRNIGLAFATGRLVLNQDSDDWAHPQKIARLVAGRESAGTVAAFARAFRLSPDEGFQCRGGFVRPDGTSLIFERECVLEAVGLYENVRAGADGEFHRRLERVFGIDQVHEIRAPLSVVAMRTQSLSRAADYRIDEETGVFTPQRNAYRRDYLRRHAERYGAD